MSDTERIEKRNAAIDKLVKDALVSAGKSTRLDLIAYCSLLSRDITQSLARLIRAGEVIKEERFFGDAVYRLARAHETKE